MKEMHYGLSHSVLDPAEYKGIIKIKRTEQKIDGKHRFDIYTTPEVNVSVFQTLFNNEKERDWRVLYHVGYEERKAERVLEVNNKRAAGDLIDAGAGNMRKKAKLLHQATCRGIAAWNVRGLQRIGKEHEVETFVQQQGIAILAIQESLRTTRDRAQTVFGMKVFESSSEPGITGHRGVMLCIKPHIMAERKGDDSPFYVFAKIRAGSLSDTPIIVGSIYIPGAPRETKVLALKTLKQCVIKLREKNKGVPLMLLGDFNKKTTAVQRIIRGWDADLQMLQTTGSKVSRFIHGRRELSPETGEIDHIFITGPAAHLFEKMKVMRNIGTSDHWPIMTRVRAQIGAPESIENPSIEEVKVPRGKMDAEKVWDNRRKIASDPLWDELADLIVPSTDAQLDAYTETMLEISDRVGSQIGVFKAARTSQPGIAKSNFLVSSTTKAAMRKRTQARVELQKSVIKSVELKEALVAAEKVVELSLKKDKCISRKARMQDACDRYLKGDTRKVWKMVEELQNGDAGISGEQGINDLEGKMQESPQGISDAWAGHYSKLAEDVDGTSRDFGSDYWDKRLMQPASGKLIGLNGPVTWTELNAVLNKLSNGKAPGSDGLLPEWFKTAAEPVKLAAATPKSGLGRVLLAFCQSTFALSYIPMVLRDTVVVSIPKKGGSVSNMDDYRGISLISIALKVVITLVSQRLSKALEKGKRLIPEQAGFRTFEEGIAQVVTLFDVVQRRNVAGLETFGCFIDLRKAYDTVPHAALLSKLRNIGVHGECLTFYSNLYRDSTMRVRTNIGLSKLIQLKRGVRQGCPGSTMLFDVFINDILAEMGDRGIAVPGVNGKVLAGLLFADDLVLLAPSKVMLGEMMLIVSKWADNWGMGVGAKKCGVMSFYDKCSDAEMASMQWKLQGLPIPVVKEYTYLGIMVTSSLDLEVAWNKRRVKGQAGLYSIRPFILNKRVPAQIRLAILRATVEPSLTYGGELFGMGLADPNPSQSIMNQGMRWVVQGNSSDKSLSAACMYTELGIPPIAAVVAAKRARLFSKAHQNGFRTWISPLVRSPYRRRKDTWVTGTIKWLKRNAPEVMVGLKPPAVSDKVCKIAWTKLQARKKQPKGWSEYVSAQYEKSGGLFSCGKNAVDLVQGIQLLIRARSRAYKTGERLAGMNSIEKKWRVECPFCNEQTQETLEHMLVECPEWQESREKTGLDKLINIATTKLVAPNMRDITKLILGGSVPKNHLQLGDVRFVSLMPEWRSVEKKHVDKGKRRAEPSKTPFFWTIAAFLQRIAKERRQRMAHLRGVLKDAPL